MSTDSLVLDRAGRVFFKPSYWQIQQRVTYLINDYLSLEILRDRLQDLPLQFDRQKVRTWQAIDWCAISSEQILGIDRDVFLSILIGTINTEAPIRTYTQTSRQYLEKIHLKMAHFVGGIATEDGTMLELGLWEKEERQHTPALIKTYQQLTGEKIVPQPRKAKTYQPSDDPYEDLYLHGFHRVMTEYGATCLYLWLMAHSTGSLQQVFAELLHDEINHMTKFWGFGVWLYPEPYLKRICRTLCRFVVMNQSTQFGHILFTTKLARTLRRMMGVLNWQDWKLVHKAELTYTCVCVMNRLLQWNKTLTRGYLQELFGENSSVCVDWVKR